MEQIFETVAKTFLCGQFTSDCTMERIISLDERWKPAVFDETRRKEAYNFFYKGFIDAMYPDEALCKCRPYQRTARLSLTIDEDVTITLFSQKPFTFFLHEITLYLFPFDMLLYSIEIDMPADDLNDVTACNSILRSPFMYERFLGESAFARLLKPLVDIHDCGINTDDSVGGTNGFDKLIENGNKLKIFQIVPTHNDIADDLLYELGTLSPVGSIKKGGDSATAPAYFEHIISENSLSVFSNWKALALFDTFTILYRNVAPYILSTWVQDYFKLIYIHSYFSKSILFRTNLRFREWNADVTLLEERFKQFEHRFKFHKISYNFLPQMVFDSIDKSLEIKEELDTLHDFMQNEADEKERQSDKRLNRMLLFLTLLTTFSTAYDATSLITEMSAVSTGTLWYNLVASLVSLVILGIIATYLFKRK